MPPSACGPLRLVTTVGSQPPFGLSLSKGFDKLSPNGSLRILKFASVPKADGGFMRSGSAHARWSY
jgi:hypothetical protein